MTIEEFEKNKIRYFTQVKRRKAMFKKKIKEIEFRCTVCGKHVSVEDVRKSHYIAREIKRGNALTLNAEPVHFDAFDCPYCRCQNILKING